MMASESRSARTDAEHKEIDELQARLASFLGTTYSTRDNREDSVEKETESQYGIGADLSSGETGDFEKWKKQMTKDMKGCTTVMFNGEAWLTWKKVVMLDLGPTGM